MQAHYDKWWAAVGENLNVYQAIIIGSQQENPMRLCSCDWAWAYADNQNNMRGCVMESGSWHVEIERDGLYNLALRRWPEESSLGIAAPAPVMQGIDGSWPEGKALPVASAWLQAGECEQTQPVPDGAAQVAFRMALRRGPATVKSWWNDAQGNQLAGAFYLTAELLAR